MGNKYAKDIFLVNGNNYSTNNSECYCSYVIRMVN